MSDAQVLNYASPNTPRIRWRVPGRAILGFGLAIGALCLVLPDVFSPISFGRGGQAENPVAVLAAVLMVVLAIAGVRRSVKDDLDPSPEARKTAATVAILSTAIGFCEQFGHARHTSADTVRLAVCISVALLCSVPFAVTRRIPESGDSASAREAGGTSGGSWLRRRLEALRGRRGLGVMLVVIAAVGMLSTWRYAGPRVRHRLYRREARQWYELARSHQFPAMSLQYSENPADVGGAGGRHFVVDAAMECTPMLDRMFDRPEVLFAHELRNAQGQEAVVVATALWWPGTPPSIIDLEFYRMRTGTPVMHLYRLQVDLPAVCRSGEIRIFSGQADEKDPSRIVIPFQTLSRTGRVVVRWQGRLAEIPADQVVVTEQDVIATAMIELDDVPASDDQ